MPSLLDLMGMKDQIPPQVEGTDYSAAFLGEKVQNPPTSTFYMRRGWKAGTRGVRSDRYTFVVETEKLFKEAKDTPIILFDRQNDPYEMKNIADQSPELVQKFSTELLGWLKKTNDPEFGVYKDILK